MTERLLTVQEVAVLLRINTKTLYRWVETGRINCIRVGGTRLRFKPSAIERWLQGGRGNG